MAQGRNGFVKLQQEEDIELSSSPPPPTPSPVGPSSGALSDEELSPDLGIGGFFLEHFRSGPPIEHHHDRKFIDHIDQKHISHEHHDDESFHDHFGHVEDHDSNENLLHKARHLMIDSEGRVVHWFRNEAEMIRHFRFKSKDFQQESPYSSSPSLSSSAPPSSAPSSSDFSAKQPGAPKSRISFARSFFLRRNHHVKDLIVPSGPQSSLTDAYFNMVKGIIGSGVLGLPLSYSWAGSVLMTVLLIFMGILNAFTGDLLIKCCVLCRLTSYNEVAERAFGKSFSVLVDVLIVIAGLGGLVVFQVLIGDFACTISNAISQEECHRSLLVYLISVIIILPLTMLPNLNSLKVFSYICMALIWFFSIFVVWSSISYLIENGPNPTIVEVNLSFDLFRSISVASVAYRCHSVVLPIFIEMKRPTTMNGYKFFDWSIFTSSIVYIGVGLFGYLQFGSSIKGNILMNFPQSDLILILVACFLMVIVVTYPLVNFVVRLSIDYLLFFKSYHNKTINSNHKNHRLRLYSILLLGMASSVGAFVTDVGHIFSLTGSITTSLLTLVLPCAIYLRLRAKKIIPVEKDPKVASILYWLSWVTIVFGFVTGIIGLVVEILKIAGLM